MITALLPLIRDISSVPCYAPLTPGEESRMSPTSLSTTLSTSLTPGGSRDSALHCVLLTPSNREYWSTGSDLHCIIHSCCCQMDIEAQLPNGPHWYQELWGKIESLQALISLYCSISLMLSGIDAQPATGSFETTLAEGIRVLPASARWGRRATQFLAHHYYIGRKIASLSPTSKGHGKEGCSLFSLADTHS